MNRLPIIQALADVIGRSSIYVEAAGPLEVERLYRVRTGLSGLVRSVPVELFIAGEELELEDVFFDIPVGDIWQLANTDHYVRVRTVRDGKGDFREGEIKVAYPSPSSNPNARFSPAEKLANDRNVRQWRESLEFLGMKESRRSTKRRVMLRARQSYGGFPVELEADDFSHDASNGKLAGLCFVSISIEATGMMLEDAERGLRHARNALVTAGIDLVECEGNYEDYFSGRKEPPV